MSRRSFSPSRFPRAGGGRGRRGRPAAPGGSAPRSWRATGRSPARRRSARRGAPCPAGSTRFALELAGRIVGAAACARCDQLVDARPAAVSQIAQQVGGDGFPGGRDRRAVFLAQRVAHVAVQRLVQRTHLMPQAFELGGQRTGETGRTPIATARRRPHGRARRLRRSQSRPTVRSPIASRKRWPVPRARDRAADPCRAAPRRFVSTRRGSRQSSPGPRSSTRRRRTCARARPLCRSARRRARDARCATVRGVVLRSVSLRAAASGRSSPSNRAASRARVVAAAVNAASAAAAAPLVASSREVSRSHAVRTASCRNASRRSSAAGDEGLGVRRGSGREPPSARRRRARAPAGSPTGPPVLWSPLHPHDPHRPWRPGVSGRGRPRPHPGPSSGWRGSRAERWCRRGRNRSR